jgi:hypothetical protein
MNNLILESREILDSFPQSKYKVSLESLLNYIISREK